MQLDTTIVPHESLRVPQRRVLFVTGFYVEEILAGIAEYACSKRWRLNSMMRFHGGFPQLDKVDGIIVSAMSEPVRDWLVDIKGLPIVHTDASWLPVPYPSVESDYEEAGRMGARHLIDLGLSNFRYYGFPSGIDRARDGFLDELADNGQAATVLKLETAFPAREAKSISREERRHWLARTLRELPLPCGIMTFDDVLSLELVEICELVGLKVPDEIAIAGCDNRAIEQALSPIPLSSVDMNHRLVGRNAAALLDDLMDGNGEPHRTIFVPPAGMIVRRSSATYMCNSPAINAAVQYLREHFHEPLRIRKLARVAGLSLRTFQSEFKKHLGRSPLDELQRVRLSHVARLLRSTDLKLDAIAVECGFTTGRYMSDSFFAAHGVRPSGWRDAVRQEGASMSK